jgi:hypothetical protein
MRLTATDRPQPRSLRLIIIGALALLVFSTPAFADATIFIGSTATPSHRNVKGFAIGTGLIIIGFEFELASTVETPEDGAPSLRTGMGNLLLQTPIPVAGMQFYLTTGGGLFREKLDERQETSFGLNSGGGVKITLFGPLRARVDYRVFKLGGDPLYSTVHRVYAGLNLSF